MQVMMFCVGCEETLLKKNPGELIARIREIHPEICLRTTMLVGYPETEADHDQLIDFIEEMQFNRLGVFTYSHEEGTHGHKLEDDVPQEVKAERASHVMEVQEEYLVQP